MTETAQSQRAEIQLLRSLVCVLKADISGLQAGLYAESRRRRACEASLAALQRAC